MGKYLKALLLKCRMIPECRIVAYMEIEFRMLFTFGNCKQVQLIDLLVVCTEFCGYNKVFNQKNTSFAFSKLTKLFVRTRMLSVLMIKILFSRFVCLLFNFSQNLGGIFGILKIKR